MPLTLFRYGKLRDPGPTFWTPIAEYIRHCKGRDPNLQATLREGARVRRVDGSARSRVIRNAHNQRRWDVLVFSAWDYNCEEYVVLNPDVLQIARLRKRKK